MRPIKYIVVHCSATKENQDIKAKDIDAWHKKRGWTGIGYHYVIGIDGKIENGRPEEKIGAHVKGYNSNSIGVCYVGGLDINLNPKDTRTTAQKTALKRLLKTLKKKYKKAKILGHRDFSKDLNGNGIIESFEFVKECPCFNAKQEYEDI